MLCVTDLNRRMTQKMPSLKKSHMKACLEFAKRLIMTHLWCGKKLCDRITIQSEMCGAILALSAQHTKSTVKTMVQSSRSVLLSMNCTSRQIRIKKLMVKFCCCWENVPHSAGQCSQMLGKMNFCSKKLMAQFLTILKMCLELLESNRSGKMDQNHTAL